MIQIDMPMPEKCGLCPCFHFENQMYCKAVKADKNKKIVNPYGAPRPEWCPLKEQEAKIPSIMQDAEGIWSTCSMCGHKLRPILAMKMDTYFPKFCSKCGQAVKWE